MTDDALFDPATARDCERGKLPRGSVALVLLAILLTLAMLGYLGGGKSPRLFADSPQATLTVKTPIRLRSGLFFEQVVQVRARTPLADAVIGIGAPLWQDTTINSMIPAAADEGYEDGQYRLHYGPLKAGDSLTMKIDGQINPPLTVGTRGVIALFDGQRQIAEIPLHIRVLP